MKPIRVLAVVEASTITGPAKNLLEFARVGRAEGVETAIATFARGDGESLFIRAAREQGTRVEVVRERGPWDPEARRALSTVFEDIRPDVIQTHAVKSHFLARLAGITERAPWLAFHHGYTWPTLKARLYNELDRWSLRTARRVVTVSEPFRDELARRGVSKRRIEVVHNSIRPGWGEAGRLPEAASALRGAWGIPENGKTILIVGRLSKEKDHATLLEAVRALPDVHLAIVGDGPERGRIEAKIASLGLTARVTMTGQVDSAEPFYGIADVAVLSSLSEGSPNALLEAMAAGVPAVATRVGGVPEIATHGESALLVEPRDAAGLRDALGAVLANANLARTLAERGKALVRERHSPEARARRLGEIYRGVLSAQ